ncbi:PAS domain S-box protein [Rufibacter aurantiacus]|uniref:PAS domain S-box protein n=1 Tax=Rufibacter aurantiacus TaxID=2817374 RepID=UPI001B310275|nr:PAS domain S-box protein [Rufibacter aurantiacus]
MHIQRTLFGVFLVAFLSLLFFTVLAYFNLKENDSIDRQEKVSLRVLKSIESLYNNLQDIEEGTTTFLASGQQNSLAQYQAGASLYPRHLQALQQAGVTDIQETAQIRNITARAEVFTRQAASLVSQARNHPVKQGASALHLKSQLAQIKALVHMVEEKERSMLHFADADATERTQRMFATFAAFSAIMFFFFIATYWLINKHLVNRSRTAKALREKEQIFSSLFYKSPTMLSLVDAATGNILDTNDNALGFFGHTREQVIGKTAESAGIFVDNSARKALMERLTQDQKVNGFEMQVKAKGRTRDVLYNIEKVLLNNQECLLLAFEDITDRKIAEQKLKDSEALFSQIFYKSPIMKCISEAETGVYLEVNDNYAQFFGYEKEEFIGKNSAELNIWKRIEDRPMLIKELREKGPLRSLELEARTKNGAIRHISAHADLVHLDGRECLVTAFVDINEQKEADELLKSLNVSLEKNLAARIKEISDYKYALDQSSIVAIADKNKNLIYANDNFCVLSGFSKDELIGKSHRINDAVYHSEEFYEKMWETLYSGNIWKGEIKNMSKSGATYWTANTIVPIKDDTGAPHQFLVIRWDITAEKDAEAALLQAFKELEKSESRLKEAQALSHLGSWEYNLVTGETIWSEEIYRILDTTPAQTEPTFLAFMQFIHPEDVDRVKELVRNTLASTTAKSCHFDCRIVRKNGDIRYLFHEFEKETNQLGQREKLLGIVQDVTQERLTQIEKERITADLLQRNKDLEQFAYIVSHNLRAPVANIIGLSNLIKTLAPENPLFHKSMEGLRISVDKLDEVIIDLNNVLQVRQEVNERKEQVDLNQLVDDIRSMTSGVMTKEKVSIKTDFSDLDKIYTIKSYLHSIFSNLISNSIKYRQANQKPAIEIQGSRKDGKNIITFRDNGLGIDLKSHQHKIFGLYKRFHFHTDGKGMGLFMVKTQVEALGGKIHVQSELNQGTEFSIEFEEAYT